MPRCPSGAYFTASTAARASSAVLTWGTCTPHAPRSRNGAMNLRPVPDRAHDGRHTRELGGGDTGLGGVDRDRAVLVVEQDPVEPEMAEHLHHGRRGKGAHDAEGRFPGVEPLLQRILAHARRVYPAMNE